MEETINDSSALAIKGTCHPGLCGWREGASVWWAVCAIVSDFLCFDRDKGRVGNRKQERWVL